jgi:sulfatase maturation enzyme AslB (radical SAM superfamily)
MKHFCVLPWYGVYYETNEDPLPCCLLDKNTNIEELKQSFTQGERPEACKKCWDDEDNGSKSKRQFENIFLDDKLNKDIEKIAEEALSGDSSTIMYQLKTSNLCNSACVTCSSYNSTTWIKYETLMGKEPYKLKYAPNLSIDYTNAVSIVFAGGEPLFDPKVFNILNKLIEAGNTDCFISFVTNGSVPLANKHKSIIDKFTNLNFCISIDGTERVFEYLRYPLKWVDLLKNIDYFRSITTNISASFTISNMSNLYKDETINWFDDQNIPYNINYVTYPMYFEHNVKPGHMLWGEFINVINKQDIAKGININEYLPKISKLINNTK